MPIQFPGVPPTGSAGGVEGPKKPGRPSAPEGRARADHVAFSPRAQEVLRLRERLASVPDVRPERVASIRRQVAAGTYGPDARAVAADLLRARVFREE